MNHFGNITNPVNPDRAPCCQTQGFKMRQTRQPPARGGITHLRSTAESIFKMLECFHGQVSNLGGRVKGNATRGNNIDFGDFALVSLEPFWLTNRQLEAARVHHLRLV